MLAVSTGFFGVNDCDRTVVKSDTAPEHENAARTVFLAPESEWTEMGWALHPQGLYETLCRTRFDSGPPRRPVPSDQLAPFSVT